MAEILAEIVALNTSSSSPQTVRLSSSDDKRMNNLDAQIWFPAIYTKPKLARGNFSRDDFGKASVGKAQMSLSLTDLTRFLGNFPQLSFAKRPIKLYAGEPGDSWPWTLIFDGRIIGVEIADQFAQVGMEVVEDTFDVAVLSSNYAGTGGIEGGLDLKNAPKPMALGRVLNAEPVLINTVDNIYQVHGYGAVSAIPALYERAAAFGSSFGDYADYAALLAASVPAGRWATCLAQGLIKLGAPAAGVITADIDGDNVGGTFWRKTGQIIKRIAGVLGLTSVIDTTAWDALDSAVPRNVNVYLRDQINFINLAQEMVAALNASAGVTFTGKLSVWRIAFSSPAITLDGQGRSLPPVSRVVEQAASAPYGRMEMLARRSWRVHSSDEIATAVAYVPRGDYSASDVYREGDIVTQAGADYVYISLTPTAGNAPPNATYWTLYKTAPSIVDVSGAGALAGLDTVQTANLFRIETLAAVSQITTSGTTGELLAFGAGLATDIREVVIADVGIEVGDVVSAYGEAYQSVVGSNIRLRLIAYDGAGSTISVLDSAVVATSSGMPWTPFFINGYVLPSGTVRVGLSVRTEGGVGTMAIRRGCINAGALAQGYAVPTRGADVTALNTSADTEAVYGVPSGNIVLGTTEIDETWSRYGSVADIGDNWLVVETHGERSFVSSTVSGGTALQLGDNSGNDQVFLECLASIPFDPEDLYEVFADVEAVHAGSGSLYLGVTGRTADRTNYVNATGANLYYAQHYVGANATAQSTLSGIVRLSGFMRGVATNTVVATPGDPANPSQLQQDVRHISPMLLVNFTGQSGTINLHRIGLRKVQDNVRIPYGQWSSGEYPRNAEVVYNGSTFLARKNTSATPPTLPESDANWLLIAADGASVTITATAQAFTFVDGAAEPPSQSITFLAVRKSAIGTATFTTTPSVTLTGTGDSRSLSLANFGSNGQIVVKAQIGDLVDEIVVIRVDRSTAQAAATRNVPAGTHNSALAYVSGDIVTKSDGTASYIAKQNVPTGTALTNTSYWDLLVQGSGGVAGDAGVSAILSNNAHTVTTLADGTGGNYADAGGQMTFYEGALNRNGSTTFAKVGAGSWYNINSAGVYTISDPGTDNATCQFDATYGGVTLRLTYSIAKSKTGAQGEPGQAVKLLPSGQAFVFTDNVADPSSQSLTFNAVREAVSGTAVFATSPTVTLTGTGDSRDLSIAAFGSNKQVVVTVTIDGKSDNVTVIRLDRSTAEAGADVTLNSPTGRSARSENLVPNPDFAVNLNGWYGVVGGDLSPGASPAQGWNGTWRSTVDGGSMVMPDQVANYGIASELIGVLPGRKYRVLERVWASVENGLGFYSRIVFSDASGGEIFWSDFRGGTETGLTTSAVTREYDVTAPAGAFYARRIYYNYSEGTADFAISLSMLIPYAGVAQWGADVTGANTSADTAAVNGTLAATVATAVGNYNAQNDRLATAVANPSVAADGTAVDHTVNTDGSVDISFEWSWSGNSGDIDGFQVYVRARTSDAEYTFGSEPALEGIFTMPVDRRALVLPGTPADLHYTFGVRAYRTVDRDISASGYLASSIISSSRTEEDPYQPSSTVAFAGNVSGTVGGVPSTAVRAVISDSGTIYDRPLNTGSRLLSIAKGLQVATVFDGQTLTFSQPFEPGQIPIVIAGGSGGYLDNTLLSASSGIVVQLYNVTATSCVVSAKHRGLVASVSNIVENTDAAGGSGEPERIMGKTSALAAVNGQFTFQVTAQIDYVYDSFVGDPFSSFTITYVANTKVDLMIFVGTWQVISQISMSLPTWTTNSATPPPTGQTVTSQHTIVAPSVGTLTGTRFGARISAGEDGVLQDIVSIEYVVQSSSPTEVSATPPGSPGIPIIIVGGS